MNKNINDSGRGEHRVITGDEEKSSLEQEFEFLSLAECKDYWDQNRIISIDTQSSTLSSYSMSASDSEDPIALDGAENEQTPPNRLKHRISEIEPKINDVYDDNCCIQEKAKHLESAVDAMYAKKSTHREKCEEHSEELYRKGAEEKQQHGDLGAHANRFDEMLEPYLRNSNQTCGINGGNEQIDELVKNAISSQQPIVSGPGTELNAVAPGEYPNCNSKGSRSFVRMSEFGIEAPCSDGSAANFNAFECKICGFQTMSKFHYNSHMNTHTFHQCRMCSYLARTEVRLKRHMKASHTLEQRQAAGIGEDLILTSGSKSKLNSISDMETNYSESRNNSMTEVDSNLLKTCINMVPVNISETTNTSLSLPPLDQLRVLTERNETGSSGLPRSCHDTNIDPSILTGLESHKQKFLGESELTPKILISQIKQQFRNCRASDEHNFDHFQERTEFNHTSPNEKRRIWKKSAESRILSELPKSDPRRKEWKTCTDSVKVNVEYQREPSIPKVVQFYCRHCMMSFNDKALYLIHRGFHGFALPFKCSRCGHVSENSLDFNMHLYQAQHAD